MDVISFSSTKSYGLIHVATGVDLHTGVFLSKHRQDYQRKEDGTDRHVACMRSWEKHTSAGGKA